MLYGDADVLIVGLVHCGERNPIIFCRTSVPIWVEDWSTAEVLVDGSTVSAYHSFAWSREDAWKQSGDIIRQWSGRVPLFVCSVDEIPEIALITLAEMGFDSLLTYHAHHWERLSLTQGGRIVQRLRRHWTLWRRGGFIRKYATALSQARHDVGFSWVVDLPQFGDCSDSASQFASRLVVFEGGRPLGPAHCPHELIRSIGAGRYSHWADGLWFSASDNSDPNSNGKIYSVWQKTDKLSSVFDRLFLSGANVREKEDVAVAQYKELVDFEGADVDAQPNKACLIIGYLGAGGAERQICNLAVGLKEEGWSPTILAQTLTGAGAHFAEEMRIAKIGLQALDERATRPGLRDMCGGWLRLARAARLLRSLPDEIRGSVMETMAVLSCEKPELVICYLDKTNIIGGLAALLAGVPRILLCGRNINPTNFPYLDRPWFSDLYKMILSSSRVTLMANSHAGAQSYADWLEIPRISVPVVHNGLSEVCMGAPSIDEIAALRFELGIGTDTPLILGVFRLSPEKRPYVFIDIIARLREVFPTLHAAIAGDGIITEEVANFLLETGQDSFITLLGRRNDVPALLGAADLVLHVSEAEGVPNALMEAQWIGCPVVSTSGGGTAEIIAPSLRPHLHAVDNVEGLYQSCLTLLNDRAERKRLGKLVRGEAHMRFSVKSLVRNTLAVYLHKQSELDVPVIETRKMTPPHIVVALNVAIVSIYLTFVLLWLLVTGKLEDPGFKYWVASFFRSRFRCDLKEVTCEEGYCYVASVSRWLMSDAEAVSALHLLEDGHPIGPGHAQHADIRTKGQGRFSHWGDRLYFSTSDNSDPATNGRTYTIVESRLR